MPDIISMNIVGIKCDHCTWHDNSVRFEDYNAWLNKPCPVCGHNLLTEIDLKTAKKMLVVTRFINRYFGWMAYFLPKDVYRSEIHMNGTGEIKVGEPVKIKSK
jgi:hypothetical protein